MELWSCSQLHPQLASVTRKRGDQNTRNEAVRRVSIRTRATPSRLIRPSRPGVSSSCTETERNFIHRVSGCGY